MVQVVRVVRVVRVFEVVQLVSLDDIHSENIWFTWSKLSTWVLKTCQIETNAQKFCLAKWAHLM